MYSIVAFVSAPRVFRVAFSNFVLQYEGRFVPRTYPPTMPPTRAAGGPLTRAVHARRVHSHPRVHTPIASMLNAAYTRPAGFRLQYKWEREVKSINAIAILPLPLSYTITFLNRTGVGRELSQTRESRVGRTSTSLQRLPLVYRRKKKNVRVVHLLTLAPGQCDRVLARLSSL